MAANRYLYNEKEFQVGSGYLDYGARMYMPEVGRWGVVDPLSEKAPNRTPYRYGLNNPMRHTDPTGMFEYSDGYGSYSSQTSAASVSFDGTYQNETLGGERIDTEVTKNKDGSFRVTGGKANSDRNVYVVDQSGKRTGEIVGETLTEYSFHDDNGNAIIGATINPNDQSGYNFFNNEIKNIGLLEYISNAQGGQPLDFKTRDKPDGVTPEALGKYTYRGMSLNGKLASARDIGNYAAGYVAGTHGFGWKESRFAFDALQTKQILGFWKIFWLYPFNRVNEGQPTQKAQRAGYNLGYSIFK